MSVDPSALYDLLKKTEQPHRIAGMTVEERRDYNRAAKAASRARQRQEIEQGVVPVTVENTRDLLADIAIAILATNAPGAETIERALIKFFHDRPGYPSKIKLDCKSGKLRSKILAR